MLIIHKPSDSIWGPIFLPVGLVFLRDGNIDSQHLDLISLHLDWSHEGKKHHSRGRHALARRSSERASIYPPRLRPVWLSTAGMAARAVLSDGGSHAFHILDPRGSPFCALARLGREAA